MLTFYIEINAICIIILALIFYSVSIKYHNDKSIIPLKMLLIIMIIVCFTDAYVWGFDGIPGTFNGGMLRFLTFVYFAGTGYACNCATLYVFRSCDIKLKRRYEVIGTIPAIVLGVLSFTSMFTNIIFNFDNQNVYSRGNFYNILLAISFFYLFVGIVVCLVNLPKSATMQSKAILLLKGLILVMPMIGGIIQTIFFGTIFLWPLTTIAVLIMYMIIISHDTSYDYLTNVYNKGVFENNSTRIIRKKAKSCLIIVDIDNFKSVNDSYGHKQGDALLKLTASTLCSYFNKSALVGRIGGDEFAVMVYNYDNIQQIIDKCNSFLNDVNNFMSDVAKMNFSCSIGIVENVRGTEYQNAYQNSDSALYTAKKLGRNQCYLYTDDAMQEEGNNIILVVDDDSVNRVILSSYLEGKCGVLEATNGQEAYNYIRQYRNRIKLVLLDLVMPVMDGYKLINKLKDDGLIDSINIVLISSSVLEEKELKNLGVKGEICKPFDPLTTLTIISKYIK